MIWYVCFTLSAVFAAAALIWAIVLGVTKRGGKVIKPFNVLFAGVAAAVFTLQLPIFVESTAKCPSWLKTVLLTLHGTFQVFTIDSDRSLIVDSIHTDIAGAYSAYMSALFVIAPIMTFGFLLSLFRTLSANFRYTLCYFRPVYAFSELNERSVALGRSIREHHRNAVLFYADAETDADGEKDELIEQVRPLGAILSKRELCAVPLRRHSKKSPISLFTIGKDELENVTDSLLLAKSYSDRPETKLYVFSTRKEAELLFASASTKCLKVRRVNEVRSLIYRLLDENGQRLFGNAVPCEDGTKLIHAVIVGLGRHGQEMLKALTWYCQMDGYSFVADVCDKDKFAEENFTAACPELMSPVYNGVRVKGETEYLIRIHSGIDASTKAFADMIAGLTDITYAFVCLGTDEDNINAAVNLRTYFERIHIRPEIDSVVYNTAGKKALTGLKNYRGQEYLINFVGDMETSYSEDNILNSKLEKEALERHLRWGSEDDFWGYEYNYNSSVALAIHHKAKMACGIPGADKKSEELSDRERDIIEHLEHRRWNAYMRAEGYIYSGSKDKKSRNDLGKMHHDLVNFEELSDEEKRKDSTVGTSM